MALSSSRISSSRLNTPPTSASRRETRTQLRLSQTPSAVITDSPAPSRLRILQGLIQGVPPCALAPACRQLGRHSTPGPIARPCLASSAYLSGSFSNNSTLPSGNLVQIGIESLDRNRLQKIAQNRFYGQLPGRFDFHLLREPRLLVKLVLTEPFHGLLFIAAQRSLLQGFQRREPGT